MTFASNQRLTVYAIAIVAAIIGAVAIDGAIQWYGHPFASVLLGPDGDVSGIGSPSWEGLRQGLRFPDRVVSVDGRPLAQHAETSPATTWDDAVADAAAAHRESVHVEVETTTHGRRTLDLPIKPFGALEWWCLGGVLFLASAAYITAALTALVASPKGPLARSFAKTALACAAFDLTLFDVQTTRALVPIWELSLAIVPGSFVVLAMRLPDDVPLLRRFPSLPHFIDLAGLTLGGAMIALNLTHESTIPVRSICSLLFAASQVFFVATFVTRFVRARGERRTVMRALVTAVAPLHLLLGVGILLTMLSSRGSAATFLVSLPILSLTPLSAVTAFIRHDLWGSRALLSRVITLAIAASLACFVAVGLAAAAATSLGVPFRWAILAAGVGSLAAAVIVPLVLRAVDRGFFPSRAEYKPTIDKLSEHLTSINDPDEVARSVERTVKRWLACESVDCIPRDPDDTPVVPLVVPGGDELTLPISFRGEMIGVLHVGKKRGGALFTSDDLDLLRTIVNQAALALAHARSYRELEERRRQQAEAWRGERLALVETLAAEIAHEIRYPINYFRSVFQRGGDDGGARLDAEDLEIGQEEVDRLERLVSGLRRVAHHRLERRVVQIADLAARAEVLLRDALGARTIDLAIPDGAALRGDFDQTTQVVVNLLANALDASGPTGRVGLAWREPERGGAQLVVWDTGPGFEGEAARLFAPWFTTKPRGTGLGLAITQRIVRAHGWSIDARRIEGRTLFLIDVPASDVVDEDAVEEQASTTAEPLH